MDPHDDTGGDAFAGVRAAFTSAQAALASSGALSRFALAVDAASSQARGASQALARAQAGQARAVQTVHDLASRGGAAGTLQRAVESTNSAMASLVLAQSAPSGAFADLLDAQRGSAAVLSELMRSVGEAPGWRGPGGTFTAVAALGAAAGGRRPVASSAAVSVPAPRPAAATVPGSVDDQSAKILLQLHEITRLLAAQNPQGWRAFVRGPVGQVALAALALNVVAILIALALAPEPAAPPPAGTPPAATAPATAPGQPDGPGR